MAQSSNFQPFKRISFIRLHIDKYDYNYDGQCKKIFVLFTILNCKLYVHTFGNSNLCTSFTFTSKSLGRLK